MCLIGRQTCIEEKTIKEIAEETGRDPHTLSQALFQGKERLRKILRKEGYTDEVIDDLLNEQDRFSN